jgi:hypothetical protein
MKIEDYTDLFFQKADFGYQDTQKISLKSYPPELRLLLECDLSYYIIPFPDNKLV